MKTTRFPLHPGKVLARSLQLGLSATAYLAKTRTTKTTRHLYEGGKGCKGIKNILKEGQENYYNSKRERKPDASHLQIIERNVRRSHHKIIFNTSVPYGNIETKRKRRKEDRKYINNLADYYGAILRTLAAEEFQFPPPMLTYTNNGEVKWVYPGNTRIPEFAPQHTAPELDFVDMIRPHGLELIRQCLKYSVPMRDARRYLDELVSRLTPFLEQVYSGQRKIESGFVRGSAKVLREAVLEIRARHGGTNGHPLSITGMVSQILKNKYTTMFLKNSNCKVILDSSKIFSTEASFNSNSKTPILDSFFLDIADKCDVTTSSDWKKRVVKLRELANNKTLRRDDAKYIMKDLLEQSRKLGTSFHDFVSNAEFATRPFSLSNVFRYGDEIVTEKSEFLFTCEVSIADGRGRVDILLFRRKELQRADDSQTEYIWEPCMLLEVKTRCFYNLDLYAVSTKSKDSSRRIIEHTKELRRSEKDEWQKVIDATPIDSEREQLAAYEREVIESYSKYARRDLSPPTGLMKGVLVVDLKENWELLCANIKELILEAYHRSEGASFSKREHFHFDIEDKDLRLGLVVFSETERRESTPVEKVEYLNPFHTSKKQSDSREFILYLTVAGKGSPAQSASQVASKWHGLELIHERTKGTHRNILWFDLVGALATPEKRKRVFRTTLQPSSVRRFLKKRVRFIDLSKFISSYLQGDTALTLVQKETLTHLKGARRPVIVVTGSNKVRGSTTREKSSLYERFLAKFVKDVPERSTVFWFDIPVPTTQTSSHYDSRSIAPFYRESPWINLVDEIIYNIPTAPRRCGSYVPVEDDQRWLVTEKNNDFTVTPILIPPLYRWGERFRSDSARMKNITRQNTFYLKSSYSGQKQESIRIYDEDDEEALLELLPHLQRFYEEESGDSKEGAKKTIKRTVLSTTPSSPQPFLSRVVFTPDQYLTEKESDGRVTRLEPLVCINHQRQYRESRLYGTPRKVTTQTPHVALLKYQPRDCETIVKRELRGIRRALKLVRKRHGEKQEWRDLIDSISRLVDRKNIRYNQSTDELSLLQTVKIVLETHPLSQRLWHQLRPSRTRIPQGLTPEQELVLKKLTAQYPDLLSITSSQLFLLLLSALYEAGVLEPSRNVSEKLWQYLVPWQLVALGFEPEYPPKHQTGVSVFHRSILIDRLAKRTLNLQNLYKKNEIHQVQFGRAILVNEMGGSSSVLLSFQTRPESKEMNTIFIRLPSGAKGTIVDILRGSCRERPFWGESDLTRLGSISSICKMDTSVDIMVATQGGVRGLWVLNADRTVWTAIGQLDYFSRQREQVTLLMSMTLREETELTEVSTHTVGIPGSYLRNIVEVGLGTVSAVFRKCKPVRCQVSLDTTEQMFRVSFLKAVRDEEITHLLIKHTVDVLEVLRRPDFQCQQVVVDEHEMIWNRFKDIDYVGDTKVLRPWVERREPFKTVDLGFPSIADQFVHMDQRAGLKLSILHDRGVCPLCVIPKDELKERIQKYGNKVTEYLHRLEGNQSQPDDVLSESMYRHGLCWRVTLKAEEELTEAVQDLEDITMSGPALATLLKTGSLVYNDNGHWVKHEFDVPHSSSLPREFRESIILVEAYRELAPRALQELQVPGSYLVERDEQWIISTNFQKDAVVWSARSDTTGETYQGQSITVLIDPRENLEDTSDRVINSIIRILPSDSIRNFRILKKHVKDMLRSQGNRSKNLYAVDVASHGDLVTFTVEKIKQAIVWQRYGSVRVAEGMTLDDVFELLRTTIDKKIDLDEYELESPDELRESLSNILRKIASEQGWNLPEEKPTALPLDALTAAIEHGRLETEVQGLRETGKSQQAFEMIDKYLEKVRPSLQNNNIAIISSFVDVLLLKIEVLVSGELAGSVDPVLLLSMLDQVEEYSYHFETRVLKSNTTFAKRIKWALALRNKIRSSNQDVE